MTADQEGCRGREQRRLHRVALHATYETEWMAPGWCDLDPAGAALSLACAHGFFGLLQTWGLARSWQSTSSCLGHLHSETGDKSTIERKSSTFLFIRLFLSQGVTHCMGLCKNI
jgi:hypothetical protein